MGANTGRVACLPIAAGHRGNRRALIAATSRAVAAHQAGRRRSVLQQRVQLACTL